MDVEIHPNFSFNNHSGFLPFKFTFNEHQFNFLKNKQLLSGFELYINDFELTKETSTLINPNFFQKLIGKRKDNRYFESKQIDAILKNCHKQISFNFNSSTDSFEARFAILTSAIITELTDGLYNYPADNIWCTANDLVEKSYEEVREFENTLIEENITFHEFKEWVS
ncbi:hypothetical protein ACLI08_01215 [Flavobacterium sp. RNTU_13]|uniref:hypothetical protein n=1 Tax=Flavobacterium sp. RNTU_13 TaxID=3375145 RepID=UPI0039857983